MAKIVRIADMTDEEKEKWQKQVIERNQNITSSRITEQERANKLFYENIAKNEEYDTNKHTTTIGDIKKAYKNTSNYDTVKNSLNQYYKDNKNKKDNSLQTKSNMTKMIAKSGHKITDNTTLNTLPMARNVGLNNTSLNSDITEQDVEKNKNRLQKYSSNNKQNSNTNIDYKITSNTNILNSSPAELEFNKVPIVSDKDPRLQLSNKKPWEYNTEDYNNLAQLNAVNTIKSAEMINDMAKTNPAGAFLLNTAMNASGGIAKTAFDLNNLVNTGGLWLTKGIEKGADLLGNEDLAMKAKQTYDKRVAEGSFVKSAGDFISNANQQVENELIKTSGDIANVVSNQLTNFMLGQSTNLPATSLQGLEVAGASAQEVLNDNPNNLLQATATGALKGYIAKEIEKLFGANILTRGTSKSSIDKIITKQISKIFKSDTGKEIANSIMGVTGENIEEFLEDNLGYVIDKLINNKDLPSFEDWLNNTSSTAKTTTLSTIVMQLLGFGGESFKSKEIDVQSEFWINEAKKIIDKNKNSYIQLDDNTLNLQQNEPSIQNNIQEQQITQQENKNAQNGNMAELNTNIANIQEALYNTNERESDVNEERGGIEQNDKRRVQELLEKFERGQEYGTTNSKELRTNQIQQNITEGTVKQEIINYAKKYQKNNLTEQELKLKNIINSLGGNVIFYELGIENVFPGLADTNEFYIDTIGNENINNIFYHELTHYLRQNNNPIYVSEIQPIVNEIASDYDYQEAIFNYASTSKELFDIRKLNGTRQLELAEEVVADYNASFYGDMSIDYGLPDNIKNRIKSAMDKIISQSLNNNIMTDINKTQESLSNISKTNISADTINPYKNVAKANKLIQEKNNNIRELEKDSMQAKTQEEKDSISKKIEDTQNSYSSQIQDLFDEIREVNKQNMAPSAKNNVLDTSEFAKENPNINIGAIKQKLAEVEKQIKDIENIEDDLEAISRSLELEELESKRQILQSKIDEVENTPDTINNIVSNRKDKRKISEKTDEFYRDFQKYGVNKYYNIDKLADNTKNNRLKIALDNWIGSTQSAETTIDGRLNYGLRRGTGQTDINNNVIGESVTEILKPIYKGKKMLEFTDYMLNLHNIARVQEKKPIFPETTSVQSKIIAEKYENSNPEFKEIANKLYKFLGNELQNAVDAGIGNQEQYNYIRNKYPYYVPTYRNITELRNFIDNGEITNKMIQRAVGGDNDVLAIDVAISEYVMSMRKKIALNNLLGEIKNSLESQQQLETYADMEGENDFIEGKSDNMLFQDVEENNLATYYENGEAQTFKIPKNIYELLKPQKKEVSSLFEKIGNISSSATNTFRKSVTTYSPGFTIRNFVKDFSTGMQNTKYTAPVYFKNYLYGIEQILTNGKKYKQYKNSGLQGNTKYSKKSGMLNRVSRSNFRKYNPFSLFKNALENVNTGIESAGRMAEFISSLEAGNDINTAKYDASEVTLNFKRGGILSKGTSKYLSPFFNSSVLAVDKVIKNATGKNGTKAMANFYVMATVSGVGALVNHLLLKDDEDYEELPEYIKDGFYLIPKGDGKFYRIPKDAVSIAVGASARRVYQMASKEDISELGDMLATIFDNLGIGNPFTENVFAGVGQAIANKSWYGEEIVSDSQKDLVPELQYDARTSEISKWLANKIAELPEETKQILSDIPVVKNVYDILSSPKKSNYVMEQYFGGFGDFALPLTTPYAEENYVEKELTTNSVLKSKYPSEFYNKLEKIEASYKSYGTRELEYKYLISVSKQMSDLYKKKRKIETSELSDNKKRIEVEKVQKEINKTAQKALQKVDGLISDGNTAIIDNVNYYKDSEGKWTSLDEAEMSKNENISLSTYSDYKNKVSAETKKKKANGELSEKQQLKNKDKMQIILDGNYSNKEKMALYENYVLDSSDETYPLIKKFFTNDELNIDKYLKYKMQDFVSDKEDDGTVDGKTVSGSKKEKVCNYVENMKISYNQMLLLLGTQYKLNADERTTLGNFIKKSSLLSNKEKLELYNKLEGFTVYKDGTVKW